MTARLALWSFLATIAALHGIVAWLSPLHGDDWGHLMWSATHAELSTGDWLVAFARDHVVFSKLVGYVLAEAPLVHVVLTPLVGVALVFGAFLVATQRRPRVDDWRDVTALVLLAAMIWIAAPRCGLVYFYRPYVATWLYGTALALWFLVPLRCGWRPRGAWIALLVATGFLAATAARPLGLALVAATAYGIRHAPRANRARWLWLVLAAVMAGTLVGFLDRAFDFRGYKPSVDRSLDTLMLPIQEGGELIALVLGLVMLKLTIGALWPRLRGDAAPATRETVGWLAAWVAYIVVAPLGPRYSEAALFPPAVMLAIAALPYLQWVMTSRPLRVAVLVVAGGVHVVVWTLALATYVPLAGEYRARVAKLETAPTGSVATIAPYRQIRPSFWTIGEDWADAAPRQLIAIRLFGLQDIEMQPAFRFLQPNPGIQVRFELEGVTPAQLAQADAPALWATNVVTARDQFGLLVKRLERIAGKTFSARLVVDSIDAAPLGARPLLAAAYDRGALLRTSARRTRADDNDRVHVRVRPAMSRAFPEAYAIVGTTATPVAPDGKGRYALVPLTSEPHALVGCDPLRCVLYEIWIPTF